ncbi:hypothetical protein [Gemmobacter serpentinus]|uniref:hypothetical protein n=1 Tax=Gemmobacter serpentinus TaxID=2652247 RepID=UPI00124E411E|nr:hypothetical protein [Gemmobacter serpentinus]
MDLIADMLMIAGALGLALYCAVLSRRLRKLSSLESGMGAAVAVLSAQVDDLTRTLERARAASTASASTLQGLTDRAETVAARLEVMLASMQDIPPLEPPSPPVTEPQDLRKPRFLRRRSNRTGQEVMQ